LDGLAPFVGFAGFAAAFAFPCILASAFGPADTLLAFDGSLADGLAAFGTGFGGAGLGGLA